MKSKFLTAAVLACAISMAAPGIASAQDTSSVSATGTSTFCSINGVEVSCGEAGTHGVGRPDFDMPDFGVPSFDIPHFETPDVETSDFSMSRGRPTFDRPSIDLPDFRLSTIDGSRFMVDAGNRGTSSGVTVTSKARAISNGTSTTTSTLCTVNGVEVACGAGTTAIARPVFDFDFSVFGR